MEEGVMRFSGKRLAFNFSSTLILTLFVVL